MAKNKKGAHKAKGEKSKEVQKTTGKDKEEECAVKASGSISGVKEFIDRFKSDVEKKRKAFKLFSFGFKKKEH